MNAKKKLMLIGIAGTQKDFLLSLPVLKCFLYQDDYIQSTTEIVLKHYYRDVNPEEVLKDIDAIDPDTVGFSCYVWNMETVKTVAECLVYPEVVFGGPEIAEEDMLSGKYDRFEADYVISGEGEKPLLRLLKRESYHPETLETLTDLPSPYLEGYADDILSIPGIHANIETQRGCNFRCAYCFYHKNFPTIRYRDENIVVNEIDYLYGRGITKARIVDANFLSDKAFAKRIIKGLIDRKIEMSLVCEILPQFVDEEIADLFGEYIRMSPENEIIVGIGIQTLNQESLDIIKRKIPLRCFEEAFDLLQRVGISLKVDMILGLPRETKETYLKGLEYVSGKMKAQTGYLMLHRLRVLPGTEMVEIAMKERLVWKDGSHYVHSTPDMSHDDMLYCLSMNKELQHMAKIEE